VGRGVWRAAWCSAAQGLCSCIAALPCCRVAELSRSFVPCLLRCYFGAVLICLGTIKGRYILQPKVGAALCEARGGKKVASGQPERREDDGESGRVGRFSQCPVASALGGVALLANG
jgi:hypothetical protein